MNREQIFEWAVDFVMSPDVEGGYSDDEHDPGGETNMGISATHHPDEDISSMDARQAIRIYREKYWDAYRLGELHPAWALSVFDGVVNQPGRWIIRQLQAVVGTKQDGIIGPITISAANRSVSPYHIEDFMVRRIQRYVSRRNFPRYGNGWLRRVLKCYARAVTQI